MNPSSLDRYLPESVRTIIEQSYYAQINQQAMLENLIQDPDFWQTSDRHPGLFSDHGIVHVRDIACQVLAVLKTINGILIPHRSPDQLEFFINGYAVILAYLHDIGMRDFSPYGRTMHPEYAAHAVFTGAMDDIIDKIWEGNYGHIARHISRLSDRGILTRDGKVILRELLSLSVAHSKSKIPVTVLDDPGEFRAKMQHILRHNLQDLYRKQQVSREHPVQLDIGSAQGSPEFLDRFYSNFERQSFDWMVTDRDDARGLVSDVTDVLRALRCADALRQRGTVQKTSGGYEVFVSPQSGNALYALRLGVHKLYLVEFSDQMISVGEANIASSELTADGDLRISFHRGAYEHEDALQRAVSGTAYVINDILSDTVDSFWRTNPISKLKTTKEIQIHQTKTKPSNST